MSINPNDKFKIGDLVQLKSGGPVMTVEAVRPIDGSDYRCTWFNGKKLECGNFYHATLKKHEEPST